MFNVRPDTYVPGFRVRPPDDVPGFRVGKNEPGRSPFADEGTMLPDYDPYINALQLLKAVDPVRTGFPETDSATSANGAVTPTLDPGPGGDGSGRGSDRCMLMPRIDQFGFCLYLCPDGTVRRSHDRWRLGGCRPWILRNEGLGL